MGVGSNIKQILKNKHMTIKSLSESAEIPYSTIQAIIQRDSMPKLDTLKKISVCLGVPVSELLSDVQSEIVEYFLEQQSLQNCSDVQETYNFFVNLIASGAPILSEYLTLNITGQKLAERIVHELHEIPELTITGGQHENADSN